MTQDNSAYREYYGHNIKHPPNFERCCQSVTSYETGWPRYSQCSRKRGHGPGKAYCKQHDPAVVAERRKKTDETQNKKYNHQRLEWNGPKFYEALCKIADGHNDPRTLAQEVIVSFRNK